MMCSITAFSQENEIIIENQHSNEVVRIIADTVLGGRIAFPLIDWANARKAIQKECRAIPQRVFLPIVQICSAPSKKSILP